MILHCCGLFIGLLFTTLTLSDCHYGRLRCGQGSFDPREQCCCQLEVNDVPEEDCQCCGTKAYRRNETKPYDCMDDCNGVLFHSDTQWCCQRKVTDRKRENHETCCGGDVIDTRTHHCCGLEPGLEASVSKRDGYRCCTSSRSELPYHNATMRCNKTSGQVTVRGGKTFDNLAICNMNLPVWFAKLPPPRPPPKTKAIHIRGMPQVYEMFVRSRIGERALYIPLSPYVLSGQQLNSHCSSSDTLFLILKYKHPQNCSSFPDQLKNYLRGTIIDIFARKNVTCKDTLANSPFLRLRNVHKAVIFRSADTSAILAKSLNRH